MEILIDANIIIYSLQTPYGALRKWMQNHTPIISAITPLEVLGYHRITKKEIVLAQNYFLLCDLISVEQKIIETAIKLRQAKKMSLGDSIIAATAKLHKLPLITANTKDFKHLENIEVINPLEL